MDAAARQETQYCQQCAAAYAAGQAPPCRCARPEGNGLIGQTVDGRFIIEARVGDGGMGTIYRARHVLLDLPVAVKVLRVTAPEIAGRRFLLEARAASSVSHPNVVQILDYGFLTEEQPYLVMELLEGQTLGRAMVDGPMPAPRAAALARQIAEGLQAVHARGIVHRDLKPDNVFLCASADGEKVKILDFGIAKVCGGPRLTQLGLGPLPPEPGAPLHVLPTEVFTRDGCVLGTPEYMSPEQIVGMEVDHRADQYALGCILYEMLTGALPFNHHDAEVIMRKHLSEALIPPTERRPDLGIPPALEQIVLRALERERGDRYQQMRDLCVALDAFLGEVVEKPVAPTPEPVGPAPAPRRSIRAMLGAPRPPRRAPSLQSSFDMRVGRPRLRWLLVGVPLVGLLLLVLPRPSRAPATSPRSIARAAARTSSGAVAAAVVASGAVAARLPASGAVAPAAAARPASPGAVAPAAAARPATPGAVSPAAAAAVTAPGAAAARPPAGAIAPRPASPGTIAAKAAWPERPAPLHLRIRPRLPDPSSVSCAGHQILSCRGGCQLPAGASGCVVRHPGYVRAPVVAPGTSVPDGRPASAQEPRVLRIQLRACLLVPGEDCEPARLARLP